MKDFLNSFYVKLSAVFLLLLIILGVAQFVITYHLSHKFIRSTNQQLNMNLASNISTYLEAASTKKTSKKEVQTAIHYLMVYNPRINVYVLDNKGKIINFFAHTGDVKAKSVSLKPIKQFLNGKYHGLILDKDPRNPSQQKPFSAAPMNLEGGGTGYVYVILSGERYATALAAARHHYIYGTSLKVLGIILGLTAIMGLIIFGFLTRRLRTMTKRAEAFEKGDYTVRFDDNSRDEVGQLAGGFNRMAGTIQSNVKELKKTDELRRNLIANISHDLRGPLASIKGYLETIFIKSDMITEEERFKYLQVILKNTRFLRRLIDELFELSKLDAHQVKPNKEAFSIAELSQDVVLKLKPRAKDKEVMLSSNFGDHLPRIYADIGLIERVITNLIDNAIMHTGEKGEVQVNLIPDSTKITIEVADNGKGISKEDLPHIFDRFYRADKSRSLSEGSTGLGLAIAQRIVELHDSELKVESKPAEITRFSFELPVYNPKSLET